MIAAGQLQMGPVNSSAIYTSGALHQVFGPGVVGDDADYRLVEIRNTSNATWTSPVAWLQVDPSGASVAIAVGDSTARALDFEYAVSASSLTYSMPTSDTTGLALPTLGPRQKALVGIRRTLIGASPAYPDSNTLTARGTTPL